jgi:PAS domain S-box-containing protein
MEDSLRERKELLSKSQEIAHVGSWSLDLKNNVLTWSDETYRIFGLKPKEFGATYEAFIQAVHPEDRELVAQKYETALKDKQPYEVVHRVLRPDGTVRIVHEKHHRTHTRPSYTAGTRAKDKQHIHGRPDRNRTCRRSRSHRS